ncbi:unnamed protein product [Thelazia callipaeda]|uniref:Uncharacterized protein n=1 Tax=Thelazia callipaeda TaxID=103827 RepID=A0A0N5CTU4_THECL|nr:unnamed protein product [Thelazia callipaeda]
MLKSVIKKTSLLSKLPVTTVKVKRKLSDFNHLDFIWGLRAPIEIYHPIIKLIQEHETLRTTY